MLDDDDKYDEKDNVKLDVLMELAGIIIAGLIITIAVKLFVTPINYINETRSEPVVRVMQVKNLYKNEGEYYIAVFDETDNTVYNLDVDLNDFLSYKIDDEILIKIIGRDAYILKE